MSDSRDRDILARRAQWVAGAVLTALILYLHFVFMNHAGGFWRDEAHNIQIAAKPTLSALWDAMALDSFPILFSMVLRFWSAIGLGGTDAGLRLLGLLIGSSIIAAAWCNARLMRRGAPLIFLTLFAFSSLAIRYGDSIRPYGLGIFFILLAAGLIWSAVESPAPLKAVAAGAAVVLSVQCMYTNAILVFAVCLGGIVVALYNGYWKRAALVVGIGAAGAISLLPYMGLIKKSADWVVLAQYPNTFAQSWEVLSGGVFGSGGGLIFSLWCGLFVLGIVFAAYSIFRRNDSAGLRRERDIAVFSAIAMVVSAAGFFLFFKAMEVSPSPWYFLSPMAVVAVSLDSLFARDGRWWGLCRVALAVLVAAFTLSTLWHRVQMRQTNVDLVAQELSRTADRDDLILVSPWYFGVTFQRYYKGEAPWMTLPPMADLSVHRYDLLKEKMVSADPLRPVFDGINGTLARGRRLWLVGDFFTDYNPATGQLPFVLPPAPGGPYGWKSAPYLVSWSRQTEYFIYSKNVQLKRLLHEWDNAVSPYEKSSVIMVEGNRR